MQFDREGDREISPGAAFAIGLKRLTGPCAHAACPITDGEVWAAGKCMLDGCPRQKTACSAVAIQAESFARVAAVGPGQDG